MSHTPGPWNIHPYYTEPEILTVHSKEDGEVWQSCQTYVAQGEKVICEPLMATSRKGWPGVDNRDEMMANARLIAAAPELLEALQSQDAAEKYIAENHDAGNPFFEATYRCMLDSACILRAAAIAKAEGRGE